MMYSNPERFRSLNKSTSDLLDGERGMRKDVEWYLERISWSRHALENYDACPEEFRDELTFRLFPVSMNFESTLEGMKSMYTFWMEAMVWFVKKSIDSENRRQEKNAKEKKEKKSKDV